MNRRPFVLVAVVLTLLSPSGCARRLDTRRQRNVQVAAEEFLSYLRADEWRKAANHVLINDEVYRRFDLPKESSPEAVQRKIAVLFSTVYSNPKPGNIASIKIDQSDSDLVLVSYKHEDLDRFKMRFAKGAWFYTFE